MMAKTGKKRGRPKSLQAAQVGKTLSLEAAEWLRIAAVAPPATSWAKRLRGLLQIARRARAADLRKIQKAWRDSLTTVRAPMKHREDRTILLSDAEWREIATIAPYGSWANRLRQLSELAFVTVKLEKARTKSKAT